MKTSQKILSWAFVVVLSVLLGVALVQYMVAPPLTMSAYLVLSAFLAVGLVLVVVLGLRRFARLAAVGVILASFAAGWLIAGTLFLDQQEERVMAALNPPPVAQRDHTAVIYFTHGEPPAYNPMPWLETFREFDTDKVSFIPKPFRPFFFLGFREEYLKVGGSPHNYLHQDMASSLQQMFKTEGDDSTRFYMAFLDSPPRPDETIIEAINAGAREVKFATVFVTVSSHTKAGQDAVAELELDKYGVPICFAEPLWNAESLQKMFVARANANLNGSDKARVGILLAGHGQPADWDKIYPTQTEQENSFRQSIKARLVADGYPEANIAMGWMEFMQPGLEEAALELAAQGVEKILVFATSISASSLHSLYDIPQAVAHSGIPKSIEVVNLGAWDDDPLVIQAIREQLATCK